MSIPIVPILSDEKEILEKVFSARDRELDALFPPGTEWVNPEPGRMNIERTRWQDMSDEEVIGFLTERKFTNIRKLEDGSFVGCLKLFSTISVCTDIGQCTAYAYRWCFVDPKEAEDFCNSIKEFDEVPVNRSSLRGHRYAEKARLAKVDNLGFVKW